MNIKKTLVLVSYVFLALSSVLNAMDTFGVIKLSELTKNIFSYYITLFLVVFFVYHGIKNWKNREEWLDY